MKKVRFDHLKHKVFNLKQDTVRLNRVAIVVNRFIPMMFVRSKSVDCPNDIFILGTVI